MVHYLSVTFKDLRRIIAEKNKEIEIESKFYNPNYFWKDRKLVSLDQWFQIKALQYFPNDFPRFGLPYILDNIEDQTMKQQADQWYSDFIKLMKYSKNVQYGRTECFRCLLSPDREEAAIFMGINKVISSALDANGVSVYPCRVLNRFACPYDKNSTNYTGKDDNTKRPDVDYSFYLSEIAFAIELALTKATEQDSIFKISVEDVYHVLTDKETLEKVLQQGLKEEHRQYKDNIVVFFMNMKDRIKVNDLRFY